MTEEQWGASADLEKMLASERKNLSEAEYDLLLRKMAYEVCFAVVIAINGNEVISAMAGAVRDYVSALGTSKGDEALKALKDTLAGSRRESTVALGHAFDAVNNVAAAILHSDPPREVERLVLEAPKLFSFAPDQEKLIIKLACDSLRRLTAGRPGKPSQHEEGVSVD